MNKFEEKRLHMWQQITWTLPKVFKKHRYASSILLNRGKEIKMKKEVGFFKVLTFMLP